MKTCSLMWNVAFSSSTSSRSRWNLQKKTNKNKPLNMWTKGSEWNKWNRKLDFTVIYNSFRSSFDTCTTPCTPVWSVYTFEVHVRVWVGVRNQALGLHTSSLHFNYHPLLKGKGSNNNVYTLSFCCIHETCRAAEQIWIKHFWL